jgi:hypothetical protein
MRIHTLTLGQRLGWCFSSLVYGICLIAIGFSAGVFGGVDAWFAVAVFSVAWIIGVLGLRLYVQDKDPTSFRSILAIDRDRTERPPKRKTPR